MELNYVNPKYPSLSKESDLLSHNTDPYASTSECKSRDEFYLAYFYVTFKSSHRGIAFTKHISLGAKYMAPNVSDLQRR